MNITRNYLVELQNYLPEFLRQDPEMKAILEVESKEHRVQVEVLKDIFNQMFIESATWGLSLFEKNLGLQPNVNDDYTQRRNRILIYLQQRKTVNKQFIEELFSRYVSDDSEIQVVEDNPNNTFWVIDTGGRIIYPDDLREAIETYKPAHLRYGLEMRREIYMDDEGKIRLGFASVFSGYNKILLAAPEGIEYVLNTAIIPARTGLVRVGFEIASNGNLNLKFGSVAGVFGRKEIAVDVDDLPDAFKERDSYITPKFGVTGAFRGVKKIQTETPKDSVFNIGYALKVVKSYVRKYGLDPPEISNLNVGFGVKITRNGERKINASLDDLPEIFRERDSYITPKLGISGVFKGNKRIGISKPTKESLTSTVGFCYGIFGKTVVNVDINDLPEEFKEKTSRAKAFVGIGTVASGYKKISIADIKNDKAAFGAGVLGISKGVKRITLASPEEAVARAGISTLYANNGRRIIPANLADLPEEFKEKNSYVSIRVGSVTAQNGFKKISAKIPDNAKTKLFAGANLAVTGYKVIGADLSDLSPTKKKRFHTGITHIGTMAVG